MDREIKEASYRSSAFIIDIEVNYRKNKKGVHCSIVKGKGRV
jgi:hypothetical protein